jgi:AhpD family alkylhydroperoxidase
MTNLDRIERANANLAKLATGAPETMHGFSTLHDASSASGVLDARMRELIALAISVATRCDDCIAFHTRDALRAGVTREEIMAMLSIAIYMGGGPSLMYSAHVIEAMDQLAST